MLFIHLWFMTNDAIQCKTYQIYIETIIFYYPYFWHHKAHKIIKNYSPGTCEIVISHRY